MNTVEQDFIDAIERGNIDLVEYYLQQGINPNTTNLYGEPALIIAILNEYFYVDVCDFIVSKLLEFGADPNIQLINGESPLLLASLKGYTYIVEILLRQPNINVNIQNNRQETPLFRAADRNRVEIIEMLIQFHQLDPNIRNDNDITPLMRAVENNYYNSVYLLLTIPINLNLRDTQGNTALMKAVKKGYTDLVKILLEAGADSNITDNNPYFNSSPLMIAIDHFIEKNEQYSNIILLLFKYSKNIFITPNLIDYVLEFDDNQHKILLLYALYDPNLINLLNDYNLELIDVIYHWNLCIIIHMLDHGIKNNPTIHYYKELYIEIVNYAIKKLLGAFKNINEDIALYILQQHCEKKIKLK